MTWGVLQTKPDQQKQQVKSITGQVPAFQQTKTTPVTVENGKLYNTTKAYITASIMLVCGLLCIIAGIIQEVAMYRLYHQFHGFSIWTGVLFTIAGTLAILACNKQTKPRMIGATIFSILVVIAALLILAGFGWCMAREIKYHRMMEHGRHRGASGHRRGSSSEQRIIDYPEDIPDIKPQPDETRPDPEHHHHWSPHPKNCTKAHRFPPPPPPRPTGKEPWQHRIRRSFLEHTRHWEPLVMFIASIVVVILVLVELVTGILLSIFGVRSLKARNYVILNETVVVNVPADEKKVLADMYDLPKLDQFV